MNRAGFIRASLSAVAATLIPWGLGGEDALPPIYGDGIHDDAPGIQARLDRGIPVTCVGMSLYLKSPVYAKNDDALRIMNCSIRHEGSVGLYRNILGVTLGGGR